MPKQYCTNCGSPSEYIVGSKPTKCKSCGSSFDTLLVSTPTATVVRKKPLGKEVASQQARPIQQQNESFDELFDLNSIEASLNGFSVQGNAISRIGNLRDLIGAEKPVVNNKRVSKKHIELVKKQLFEKNSEVVDNEINI